MNRRSRRLGAVSALALTLLACPAAWAGDKAPAKKFAVESIKDVAYFDGKGADPVKHKLDLFLPKGQKNFPVFFFVHGGSWRHGDKGFLGIYSSLGKYFASQGIGAVVINYRLSPKVMHPEHEKDVARAFAWTHKNVARYGGRADQIFVCGHSAGGHLVSLLATDDRYLKAEGLTVAAIKGVISISGVYSIPEKLFPQVFGTDAEVRRQASPLYHVKAGRPPFLLLCADKDLPGCDKKPAEAFAKALRDKDNKAELIEIADSDHFQIVWSAAVPDHAVSKALLAFIAAQTRKN
jgi:acetyl esterase/lipase